MIAALSRGLGVLVVFVFLFAGVGLFGAVDTVGRVEAGAEHFLLTLAVATTHSLDDIIKARCLFLLFHDTDRKANIVPSVRAKGSQYLDCLQ